MRKRLCGLLFGVLLGMVLMTSPATAWAEADGAADSSSSDSSSSDDGSERSQEDSASTKPSSSGESESSSAVTDESPKDESTTITPRNQAATDTVDAPAAVSEEERPAAQDGMDSDRGVAPKRDADESAAAANGATPVAASLSDSSPTPGARQSAPRPARLTSSADVATDRQLAAASTPAAAPVAIAAAQPEQTSPVRPTTAQPSAVATDTGTALVGPPQPQTLLDVVGVAVVKVAASFLDAFGLTSVLPTDPDDPAQPQTFLGALQLLRRQLQVSLFNSTPTASPVQISQSSGGVITGTLGAYDPDGDVLGYTVTRAPTSGSVVVKGDGTYVYTPSAALAASGGADGFTVAVDDNVTGHLHLLDFLNGNGRITVPVSVTVAPGSSAPIAVGGTPLGLAVSPDGKKLYVVESAGSVKTVDLATNAVTGTVGVGASPSQIGLSPDGKTAYVSNSFESTVSVVDTAAGTVVKTIGVGRFPSTPVVSPDGTRIYVVSAGEVDPLSGGFVGGTVSVIDASTNSVLATLPVGGNPSGLAVSPDGTRLYVTDYDADSLSVLDPVSGGVTATISVARSPSGVAVSPDGARVYVSSLADGSVSVVDTVTNAVTTVPVYSGAGGVTVSPNGKFVYVPIVDSNRVAVIDTVTDTVVTNIGVGSSPQAVALNAAGDRMYVTNSDGTVSVVSLTAAAGLPAGQPPSLASTRGFQVWNFSTETVYLVGYTGTDRPENPFPAPGTTVAPGGYIDFEITVYSGRKNTVQPFFSNTNTLFTGSKQWFPTLTILVSGGIEKVSCSTNGVVGCQPASTTDKTRTVLLLDQPGTVFQVANTDTDLQEQLVGRFCDRKSLVSCGVTPLTAQEGRSGSKPFARLSNNTSITQSITQQGTHTFTSQTSFGISVQIKSGANYLFAKFELTAKAQFNQSFTDTKTYTTTVPVIVPPRSIVIVTSRAPTTAYTGDVAATVGSAKTPVFMLDNATVTVPNPSGELSFNFDQIPIGN